MHDAARKSATVANLQVSNPAVPNEPTMSLKTKDRRKTPHTLQRLGRWRALTLLLAFIYMARRGSGVSASVHRSGGVQVPVDALRLPRRRGQRGQSRRTRSARHVDGARVSRKTEVRYRSR
jgi:hypothetical protein